MADVRPLGFGLIGCGAFAEFTMQAFQQIPGVKLVAVADTFHMAVKRFQEKYDVPGHYDGGELIQRDDVDVVHIATPPSSHYELVMQAVRAGKHVLCEKPLAMNMQQANAMLKAAAEKNLIVPVNFVLRYNEVTEAVKQVIDSGVLGKVLSARLTNCAGDSKLGPEHWFWDPAVAGGIFIEHGVHFFDLYSYWLGEGKVIHSHTETREGTTQEDRVTCELRYRNGAVVSHYHGFDQVSLMDRTDHRMVCELGDIRVDGWIPLTMTVDAVVDDAGLAKLQECCPDAQIETLEKYDEGTGSVSGRGKQRKATAKVRLTYTPTPDKQEAYSNSAVHLLRDQLEFLADPSHQRKVNEENGRRAVALAEAAAKMARKR
ncbi:MAG: Gfo/Idh/MocA family protein [Phycisphaerae bacterium]